MKTVSRFQGSAQGFLCALPVFYRLIFPDNLNFPSDKSYNNHTVKLAAAYEKVRYESDAYAS